MGYFVETQEHALVDQVFAEKRWHDSGTNRLDRGLGPTRHAVVGFTATAGLFGDPGFNSAIPFVERHGIGPPQSLLNK